MVKPCTCDPRDCYGCPYFMGLVMDGVVMCWLDLWRKVCGTSESE